MKTGRPYYNKSLHNGFFKSVKNLDKTKKGENAAL